MGYDLPLEKEYAQYNLTNIKNAIIGRGGTFAPDTEINFSNIHNAVYSISRDYSTYFYDIYSQTIPRNALNVVLINKIATCTRKISNDLVHSVPKYLIVDQERYEIPDLGDLPMGYGFEYPFNGFTHNGETKFHNQGSDYMKCYNYIEFTNGQVLFHDRIRTMELFSPNGSWSADGTPGIRHVWNTYETVPSTGEPFQDPQGRKIYLHVWGDSSDPETQIPGNGGMYTTICSHFDYYPNCWTPQRGTPDQSFSDYGSRRMLAFRTTQTKEKWYQFLDNSGIYIQFLAKIPSNPSIKSYKEYKKAKFEDYENIYDITELFSDYYGNSIIPQLIVQPGSKVRLINEYGDEFEGLTHISCIMKREG